jgi:multiple antibiotic resistance protein
MIGGHLGSEEEFVTPFLGAFVKAFIQIALAIDVLGILPIYLSMVDGMPEKQRRTSLRLCLLAGLGVGLLFMLLGKLGLRLLNITISDFEIAGGLILLLIGVSDLVGEEKTVGRPATESFPSVSR